MGGQVGGKSSVRDERWKLEPGLSGDKRSGSFCRRALMNGALSGR